MQWLSTYFKAPNCKYLGITLSDDLQWSTHISNICKSASRSLGFLRRNLRRCPTELRELAYFALVRSKLEYSCAVCDPHGHLTKDKDLLAGIQRRGARFVLQDYHRDGSPTQMLEKLGWVSLESRRRNARLTLFDRIVGGRVAINTKDYLSEASTRTRSTNSTKFRQITARTTQYQHSFFPRTVKEWNSTPDSFIDSLRDSRDSNHQAD